MILWFLRQVFYFRGLCAVQDSPRRIALGCAMGMALGLLPKGNLLAVALSTLILATRINLSTAMVSALVFSIVGVYLDSLTHLVGWSLLRCTTLEPAWTYLYSLPLAPWTSFNNTVVLGSFAVGLAMFFPTYAATFSLIRRWQPGAGPEQPKDSQGPADQALTTAGPGRSPVHKTMATASVAPATVAPNASVPRVAACSSAESEVFFIEHVAGPSLDSNPFCVCTFTVTRCDRPASSDRLTDVHPIAPLHWEQTQCVPRRQRWA